jgi:hypothetical protein
MGQWAVFSHLPPSDFGPGEQFGSRTDHCSLLFRSFPDFYKAFTTPVLHFNHRQFLLVMEGYLLQLRHANLVPKAGKREQESGNGDI